MLHVGRDKVYYLLRTGQLRSLKIGKLRRITEQQLAEFIASLQRGGFDLILADYSLPSFDGLSALKSAPQMRPLVPFIFVSGTMDEEVAIEALKIGATDYVFKTRLSRLVPSVRRALREAGEELPGTAFVIRGGFDVDELARQVDGVDGHGSTG